MQQVISASKKVREFFHTTGRDKHARCYAMLVMERHDKTAPGYRLEGDELRGDVLQTSINFTSHRLVKPRDSEEAVRSALRQRAFEHLVNGTAQRIATIVDERQQLSQKKYHLESTLRRETKSCGEELPPTDCAQNKVMLAHEINEAKKELAAVSSKLGSLENYLDILVDFLSHPELHCQVEPDLLYLNRMGIKAESQNEGEPINYADITIGGNHLAATIVAIDGELLLEPKDQFNKTLSSLGL